MELQMPPFNEQGVQPSVLGAKAELPPQIVINGEIYVRQSQPQPTPDIQAAAPAIHHLGTQSLNEDDFMLFAHMFAEAIADPPLPSVDLH